MSDWDQRQYLKFADQRTRPARELLTRAAQLCEGDVGEAVDLGCGPGNSTGLLHQYWPQARIVGVDSSSDMLQRARNDFPQLEWIQADIANWRPQQSVDLLFANASLQWLPDHTALFPTLLQCVRPGGVFAVQMPCNFSEPSHRLMRELPGPWQPRAATLRTSPVASPAFYYDLLAPHVAQLDIWQTTYEQVMPDAAAIVEWVRGTGLRPYLDALSNGQRDAYLAAYHDAIDRAYPARTDGKRLFSFPRLFIVARC